jgi:hypothetical protein
MHSNEIGPRACRIFTGTASRGRPTHLGLRAQATPDWGYGFRKQTARREIGRKYSTPVG